MRDDHRRPTAALRAMHLALASALTVALLAAVLPVADAFAPGASIPAPFQATTPTPTSTPSPTPTGTATVTPTALPVSSHPNQCASNQAPDAFEPGDNTQAGATALPVPATQVHNLCSTTTAVDIDWFRFDATLGNQYTIETGSLSAVVDTFIVVQGPAGTGFLRSNDDFIGLASQVVFTPTVAGTYFISVTQASKTPFLLSQTGEPRNYTILIGFDPVDTPTPTLTPLPATPTPTATPSPCRDEFEPDNTRGNAKGLFVKKAQRHVLCGDGDVDWIWFDAVANKPYRLFTSDLANGLDTIIVLYAADQVTILQINDDYPGLGLASRIDFVSPTTTRYYAKVQDSAGHGAEDFVYLLNLDSDGTPNAGACLDTFESDGLPIDARQILLGETQAHSFCPEGDADWVRFYALSGKSYTLATSDLTIGTDTIVTIFTGPDAETIVAQNDDGGGGLASRVDFVAPADGIYYAQIKNAGEIGGRGQRYNLLFSSGGVVAPPPATPTPRRTPTPGTIRTPTFGTATPTTPADTGERADRGDVSDAGGGGAPPLPPPPASGSLTASQATPIPAGGAFADAAFVQTWARADEPVRLGRVARSWYWGAEPGPARQEPYKGAPGGARLVQYFDKARMEITNPGADRASPWFVTNGLLVREMIDGRIQVGDDATEQRVPAAVPLAGDGDPRAPTYASLTGIAWSDGDRRVPNRTGRPVIESINRIGKIVEQRELAAQNVVNAYYAAETGHNIPDVFWQFLQQRGPIATPNGLDEGLIADWLVAFGLPLTEAYWTRATVGGVEQAVLVQAFERRILTYTPANPAAWRVEMGNVGQHYYRWRYPA